MGEWEKDEMRMLRSRRRRTRMRNWSTKRRRKRIGRVVRAKKLMQ